MISSQIAATHLALVRHGQSLYNRNGEQAGFDSGLTELGWHQSQAVANWLTHTYRADAVVSSNLVRARQTAEIIAARLGLPVITHDGLEEASAPYWEELPRVATDPLAAWRSNWQPDPHTAPTYASFRAQLQDSLQRLLTRYAGQTIIAVTHGGAIGTILRSLFGGHQILVFTENTGVTQLTWERSQWRLVCHNSTAHLAGIMPALRLEEVQTHVSPSSWDDTRQFDAIADQFRRVASTPPASPTPSDMHQLRKLVQLARPEPDDRVLDAATGTGAVALAFAPHVRSVVGIDLSPGMLEHAETARSKQQVRNVLFRLGEIGTLPLPPQSFDIIICHDLLHYVTDPAALFSRFRSLLVPAGKLLLDELIGSDDPVKRATQNVIEIRRNPVITEMLSAGEIERKLAASGFTVRHGDRYSVNRELDEWLAQAATDEGARSAVRAMLEAGLDTDSAGMSVRRNRDDQITFSQARLRLLAVPGTMPEG